MMKNILGEALEIEKYFVEMDRKKVGLMELLDS